MEKKKYIFDTQVLKRTDVTAVKFYTDDVLLIALGGTMCIHRIALNRTIAKKEIFSGQKIYGFVVEKSSCQVIVYGGKQLKIIHITHNCDTSNVIIIEKNIFSCSDWIQTACWSRLNLSITVLTAHNFVQVWDIESHKHRLHKPNEVCILYCGFLYELLDSFLVFAGTVFSQVLIYSLEESKPIQILKGHQGVIFSVVWSEERSMIVTTSDDRSVRLWSAKVQNSNLSSRSLAFWKQSVIECQSIIFGHTARVWRGLVTNDAVVSIGEDSKLCVWNLNGQLRRKIQTHQGGCIWSVDYNNDLNLIVTGGGDGGVALHQLSLLSTDDYDTDSIFFDEETVPKKISLTHSGNIVCLAENSRIIYCNIKLNERYFVRDADNSKTYNVMAASPAKSSFAFVDLSGKIDTYTEINNNLSYVGCIQPLNTRIRSLHWVDDTRVIACNANGDFTIWNINMITGDAERYHKFCLPLCKERWLTAVTAMICNNHEYFIIGDRCGNLHLYGGTEVPLHSLHKMHGHLGINSIGFKGDKLFTTGRDGSVKFYKVTENRIQYLHQIKVPFEWVELVLNNENLIIGFRECSLIIYDNYINQELVEINCGGGHRSWDLKLNSEHLTIGYIKNGKILVYHIKKMDITPRIILKGTHTKEINSLKLIPLIEKNRCLLISGSEDTSLRVSLTNLEDDLFEELIVLRQLSNVRSVSLIHSNTVSKESRFRQYLLVTAGGRAEIVIRILNISEKSNKIDVSVEELTSYMLKGSDRHRKISNWHNPETDFVPETRFMSVETTILESDIKVKSTENFPDFTNSRLILFAGCSDSYFRIFEMKNEFNKCTVRCVSAQKFHNKCILKVKWFKIIDLLVVLTMATDGIVAWWNAYSMLKNDDTSKKFSPLNHFKIHKSGINDADVHHVDATVIALATGGDDNCVNLNVFEVQNKETIDIKCLASISRERWHCAQVTGVKFLNESTLITTSIDQRVTFIHWEYHKSTEELKVDFIKQILSDVADIQGMDLYQYERNQGILCVYGKGVNIIRFEEQKLILKTQN